jgi:hypothetical protein
MHDLRILLKPFMIAQRSGWTGLCDFKLGTLHGVQNQERISASHGKAHFIWIIRGIAAEMIVVLHTHFRQGADGTVATEINNLASGDVPRESKCWQCCFLIGSKDERWS